MNPETELKIRLDWLNKRINQIRDQIMNPDTQLTLNQLASLYNELKRLQNRIRSL